MRIAIDARYLEDNGGGVGRYIKELIIHKPNNYNFICITTKPLNIQYNIENIVLPIKFHSFIWEQIQLPLKLYRLKPDVYHAVGNYGIPLFCPVPAVLTIHDIIPLLLSNYFKKSKFQFFSKILYYIRVQISLLIAKKIIVTSNIGVKQLHTKFYLNTKKTIIIPMGVSTASIKRNEIYQEKILKKYTIRKPYILNHGGLDLRKNLNKLIEAFEKVHKKNRKEFGDIELVITGKNKEIERSLKKLARDLKIKKSIKFIGYIDDNEMYLLIKNAKLVVYPTIAEGFGLPPLEAMFCKIPVVTSDLPIIRLLCKDIPYYINPNNIDSIYSGMINGLTKTLSIDFLEAGEKIALSYDWANTAKETFRIYKEIVDK